MAAESADAPDRLTHLDHRGRARMVDVGDKPVTLRECVARATVRMAPATLAAISEGRIAKGDVLALTRIAGVQAAKRTAEWIPLAHPVPLDVVEVELRLDPARSCIDIEVNVRAHAKTGVEMEALVAATAAGLTLYDMCKAIDRAMTIDAVRLVRKSGGKSGTWQRSGPDPETSEP
ncbi:MAG: cyclic pyranopterin monophosphate synthase MoaC [Myxococcota bacterium]|nr:cyclic pyranopterin monophosphate synthase MoaC [Myxococcota bacterium]